jgi:hypothetical protein
MHCPGGDGAGWELETMPGESGVLWIESPSD